MGELGTSSAIWQSFLFSALLILLQLFASRHEGIWKVTRNHQLVTRVAALFQLTCLEKVAACTANRIHCVSSVLLTHRHIIWFSDEACSRKQTPRRSFRQVQLMFRYNMQLPQGFHISFHNGNCVCVGGDQLVRCLQQPPWLTLSSGLAPPPGPTHAKFKAVVHLIPHPLYLHVVAVEFAHNIFLKHFWLITFHLFHLSGRLSWDYANDIKNRTLWQKQRLQVLFAAVNSVTETCATNCLSHCFPLLTLCGLHSHSRMQAEEALHSIQVVSYPGILFLPYPALFLSSFVALQDDM